MRRLEQRKLQLRELGKLEKVAENNDDREKVLNVQRHESTFKAFPVFCFTDYLAVSTPTSCFSNL
jgi:hypothetical protein